MGITKIYSSPLMRAKQTAQIINEQLELSLKFHEGLRKIVGWFSQSKTKINIRHAYQSS